MIISASRRTDIPAFYSPWFMNRIRARTCLVVNPFNSRQVSRVSLEPADVDVIVFWTRYPRPMFRHLSELDRLGYRYTFQYTLLGYPRAIDRAAPSLAASISAFRELAQRIGPERITWRYDPIFLSNLTDTSYHRGRYRHIAEALKGCAHRSVISIMERYRKIERRLKGLQSAGVEPVEVPSDEWAGLFRDLADAARQNGMNLSACAAEMDLSPFGIEPGRCIDADALSRVFGLHLHPLKDPSQRKACGCTVSRDIGAYDTCSFGCAYCYATGSLERARANRRRHDPHGEFLMARP
jgi:hypothetical protein